MLQPSNYNNTYHHIDAHTLLARYKTHADHLTEHILSITHCPTT